MSEPPRSPFRPDVLLHDLRSARPLHERLGLAPTHRLALAQSVDLARFAQASHAPSAG